MESKKTNNTKENMIKSCKGLKKVINGFQWLVTGIIIIPTIIMLVLSILTIIQTNAEKKSEAGDNLLQAMETINNKVDEVEASIEKIEEHKSSSLFVTTIKVLTMLLILDNLVKILKCTIDKETPFVEENIKYMKKIDKLACINWVITTPFIINTGIIYLLVISIITYIFEYGYQLQLESDETL